MSWRGRRGIDDDDAAFFGESVNKRLKSADEIAADEADEAAQQSASASAADDDEIDPLDAFMAGIESSAAKAKPNFKGKKAERIEVEDAVDVYMQQRRKALDAIARDPQLAALLAARGIDLKDEAVAELGADEIRALLLDDGSNDGAPAAMSSATSAEDEDAEEDRLAELGIEALDVEALKKSKIVPILAPIDHAAIEYPDFNKVHI